MSEPDHVESVLADLVVVQCAEPAHEPTLRALGASLAGFTRGCWQIPAPSPAHLAHVLTALRELGLPFADAPHGWPPAAVFEHLREQGLVSGRIRRISWRRPGVYDIT